MDGRIRMALALGLLVATSANAKECEIVLLQQERMSGLEFDMLGISTNGLSASSYWFSAPKGVSVKRFKYIKAEEIRNRLRREIAKRRISGNLRFLIDIEAPIHPADFYKYRRKHGEKEFASLVAAFKERIDIARELLPDARIGLYGVPTPRGRGVNRTRMAAQLVGIQAAADLGLLDQVDDLYPSLYPRFGPGDKFYKERVAGMTSLGIRAAQTIRRKDGSELRIIPLLSHRIYNGSSSNHKEIVPLALAEMQFRVAVEVEGIHTVAYWTSGQDHGLEGWLRSLQEVFRTCSGGA